MDDKEECTNVAEFTAALRKDLSVILTTVDDILTKLAALEVHVRKEGSSETLVSLKDLWQKQDNQSSLADLECLRSCEIVSVECSPDDVGSVNITEDSGCLSPPSECDSPFLSDITAHGGIEELDDDYDSCCGGEQEHWAELIPEKTPEETAIFSPLRECVAEDTDDHHECVSVSCVTAAETTTVAHDPVTSSSSSSSNISESGFKRRLLWFVNKLFPNQQKFDPEDPFILQTLYDMGFTDEKQNSKVLHECNGVIPRVLDSLLESSNEP